MLSRWSLPLLGLVALAGTAAACDGLSPGDELNVGNAICTLGFLVADPDGLYFSTAGHCLQLGDAASSPGVGEWGTAVFRFLEPDTGSQSDGSPGMDFALIEIHPDFYGELNPKVCGWNGPTGIYDETPGSGGVLQYGHGLLFGDGGPATQKRQGVALDNNGDSFHWIGPGVPGDSGGAVLAEDGRALGVLTHLTIGLGGTNGGTHIERGFRLAAEEGFTQLRLVLKDENPVDVLRELQQGAPTPPAADDAPGDGNGAPPTNATAPPANSSGGDEGNASAPADAADPADDSIAPAASDEAAAATTNRTPFAPWPLLALALVVALALARRKW